MKNKNLDKIASLLPEGLNEDVISEIATLIKNMVQENVDSRLVDLETKVSSFIRIKIDDLKEQAMKELEYENPTVRSASVFEHLKSVLATELRMDDENNAISEINTSLEQIEEENDILTSQLNTTLRENENLRQAIKILDAKVSTLTEEKKVAVSTASKLKEATKMLNEGKFTQEAVQKMKKAPFNSSERAIVRTNEDSNDDKNHKMGGSDNPFINEEVLRLIN